MWETSHRNFHLRSRLNTIQKLNSHANWVAVIVKSLQFGYSRAWIYMRDSLLFFGPFDFPFNALRDDKLLLFYCLLPSKMIPPTGWCHVTYSFLCIVLSFCAFSQRQFELNYSCLQSVIKFACLANSIATSCVAMTSTKLSRNKIN